MIAMKLTYNRLLKGLRLIASESKNLKPSTKWLPGALALAGTLALANSAMAQAEIENFRKISTWPGKGTQIGAFQPILRLPRDRRTTSSRQPATAAGTRRSLPRLTGLPQTPFS